MRGLNRKCRRCGAPFTVDSKTGGKCYCSDECRKLYNIENKRARFNSWYHRHKEQLAVKPHEMICKRCGNPFLGKYVQKYCPDCLQSGDPYMTKMLYQRSHIFTGGRNND